MRLAIISPFPPSITGIGQYGYHLSRMLAQSGHFSEIVIITGGSRASRADRAPYPITLRHGWLPDQLNVGLVIPEMLKQIQPDLVWFNLGVSMFGKSPLANLSGFMSVVQAHRLGLPTVVTMHELAELSDLRSLHAPGGPLARYGARVMTRLATRADVICLTVQRYVSWLAARDRHKKYVHIPLGAYRAPEMLAKSERQELLFFTTIAPFKGLEILLDGYRILKEKYPDLQLTVAGAEHIRFPGHLQALKNQHHGLAGVRWVGQVSEEDVRSLFARAYTVMVPYTASTGASSVIAQAAMWGRSVVASDLKEIRAVAHESGLKINYFEAGSVPGLVAAVQRELDFPLEREERIRYNFQSSQKYRPEHMCQAYVYAFNRALEARRSPKRILLGSAVSESI